jgi:hypothetical protein
VLAMSVGLMVWLANVVIAHGNTLASQGAIIGGISSRVEIIESQGSRSLGSHITLDNQRVDELTKRMEKLESAVLALQSAPGELKAINARLDSLKEGQTRMENMLSDHLKRL